MTDEIPQTEQTELTPSYNPISGQFDGAPEPVSEHIKSTIGRGGDVIFTPGQGNPSGDFIFKLADGREAMRICADGKFIVKGEPVWSEGEIEIYYAFKAWLRGAIKTANGVE